MVPARFRAAVIAAKRETDLGNAVLTQLVLARMLDSGDLERHLRLVRRRHRRRRDAMVTAIGRHLPSARIHGAAAGLHLTITFDDEAHRRRRAGHGGAGRRGQGAPAVVAPATTGPGRAGARLRRQFRQRDHRRDSHSRHPGRCAEWSVVPRRRPADRRFHPRRGGRRRVLLLGGALLARLFDAGAAQRRSDGRRDDRRAACVIACVDHPPRSPSSSSSSSSSSSPHPALHRPAPAPVPGSTGIGAVGVAGVNDPTCTSEHRPVVLLHGTFSTVRSNYAAMIPRLQATGRCVYGINYGLGGLQSVRSSAQAVATFIDQVLAVTGAEQVDVIAFSQGGLVLRTALRLDGAAPRRRDCRADRPDLPRHHVAADRLAAGRGVRRLRRPGRRVVPAGRPRRRQHVGRRRPGRRRRLCGRRQPG